MYNPYKATQSELKASEFMGAIATVDGVKYTLHEHPLHGDDHSICINVNGYMVSTGCSDLSDARDWNPSMACDAVVEAFVRLR